VPDFWTCNSRLWRDKLGQISLATTTLIGGVSGNLRYIILAWSAAALSYSTTQASALSGVVALGTAVGAVVASLRMRLDTATGVMPLGILMGLLMIMMNFIGNVWLAAPFLILLGIIGGYMVVPMNALLQHRGHNLMGAGRSIAVQNFNEQACILGMGASYNLAAGMGLSAFAAITGFGTVIAVVMWMIQRWHLSNCTNYGEEVEHLLEIARHDKAHG
jgi:LPLT family lysophospholipid transporter-like MFS transporter